ncbi:MAG: DUF885 family protein [Candidatus Marinimicrobia bacterium]|nr:DUF885 family protein [Candidatus Neomarinimicrobiota bacterium]
MDVTSTKRGVLLAFTALLLSCKGSHPSSFENLQSAFIDWYFKYHPVQALRYERSGDYLGFMAFDASSREEYTADVSRFLIELSQIDATKLSPPERIDYNMLFAKLESLKYELDILRSWEWNPLLVLQEVFEGLFLVSEKPELEMSRRVEVATIQLAQLPQVVEAAALQLLYHSSIHEKRAGLLIEQLISLLEELPLKLNADNLTLDDIDRKIEHSIVALEDYGDFLTGSISQKEKKMFPQDFPVDESAFNHYSGNRYQLEKVIRTAEKKIIPLENRIFHLSLPLYLQDHDEPVWLDRDDTLEVIRWSVNTIRNAPEDLIAGNQVLSGFYNSLSELESFIYSNNLFHDKYHASIRLDFAPSYSSNSEPAFLYHYYPKDYTREMVYYIKQPGETETRYILNKKEIDILNGKRIFPGFALQWWQAQRQASVLRYLFPAEITLAGWQYYALNMVIEEGFGDWQTDYHILKLTEELELVQSALAEIQYYRGEISREEVKSTLMNKAYTPEENVASKLNTMETRFFHYSQSFIGLIELHSIVHEYKKNKGDDFILAEFHRLALQEGIVPIHELKKLFQFL